MRRTARVVASAAHPEQPGRRDAWLSVALTFQALKRPRSAGGVLGKFPARVPVRDGGAGHGHWRYGREFPRSLGKATGGPEVHVLFAALAPTERASMRFWRRHEALTRH